MRKKGKGTVIIYLSRSCPICKEIIQNKEKISNLYLQFFGAISFRYIEDTREFLCYGFSRVPTLILPSYRPFEAISPKIIIDENYIVQMLDGTILPEDVLHIVEIERRERGIVNNPKLNALLGEE